MTRPKARDKAASPASFAASLIAIAHPILRCPARARWREPANSFSEIALSCHPCFAR